MQKYQSIISGTNGSVIRNVPVTVLKEDGSLAEIFLDREGQVPAPNPLVTDSRGVFYFYAVNGRYSLRTSVDGITITDADAVLLNDPEEITTAGPIADAVLRAEAAAQRAEFAIEASGIPDLVSQAQNAVLDANTALQGAQSAAQLAVDAKAQAASAKNAAELAQQASDTAKTGAENARSLAEQAADQARVYAESIDPAQFVQKEAGKDLMTEGERTKLANIAEQATKNATDAALRDRATHTGAQPITTITGVVGAMAGGAIIERGLNANGEYVRFLDGTQHCMLTAVFYGTGSGMRLFNWAYPAAFLEGPAITGTPIAYGDSGFFRGVTGGVTPNGNTAVNLTYDMRTADGGPIPVRLFATGRWN